MITHLFDTNIISSLMRARPPVVMDRLRALGPERVAVSVITAMELRHRADLHPKAARYHGAIDVLLREIPTLPLPIELIHGDADTTVPLTIHSQPLSTILPDARLTILPGTGHMPHHAHPDVIIAAIDRASLR